MSGVWCFLLGYMLSFFQIHVSPANSRTARTWVHQTRSSQQLFALDLNVVVLCDFIVLCAIWVQNISMPGQCVDHGCTRCRKTRHLFVKLAQPAQHVFDLHRDRVEAELWWDQRWGLSAWNWAWADLAQGNELQIYVILKVPCSLSNI